MKLRQFLPRIPPKNRAFVTMFGLLALYCIWLWLLSVFGLIDNDSPTTFVVSLLLLPLVPVSIFDLWLRLSWQQQPPTLHPPPPNLLEKLLYPEYGLFWFPVVTMIPMWVWATGLIGWAVMLWLK